MAVANNEAYVGARKEIAFTRETTRGTASAYQSGDWQPHEGFDFGPMVEKIADELAVGRIEAVQNHYLHRKSGEGSVPLAVTKSFVYHIMNMMFGQVPTKTGPVGDVYTYEWEIKNSNRHQAYTIHVKDPVAGFKQFPLGMLNSADFDLNVDAFARVSLNFMSSKEEAGTPGAVTYDTNFEYPIFMPQQISYRIADTLAGLSAASDRDASAVPFSVSKNAVKRFALGQDYPIDVINQRMGVAGSLTAVYDDTELRELAHAETKKALQIKFEDGDIVLTIQFPAVQFQEWNDDEDNDAYMNNTANWIAEYDNTDGLMIATFESTVNYT